MASTSYWATVEGRAFENLLYRQSILANTLNGLLSSLELEESEPHKLWHVKGWAATSRGHENLVTVKMYLNAETKVNSESNTATPRFPAPENPLQPWF